MSEFPEVWWSPSVAAESPAGMAYGGMLWRYESGRGYVTPPGLPADAVRVTVERPTAPIDWPARFRAAAEVAAGMYLGGLLLALSKELELCPDKVEAIGRALLGETS
jgi:hypothetical protein